MSNIVYSRSMNYEVSVYPGNQLSSTSIYYPRSWPGRIGRVRSCSCSKALSAIYYEKSRKALGRG